MNAGWLAVPRGWLNSIGEIFGFCTRVAGLVFTGRVFQFFGEALRQTGIIILGSTIVIWGWSSSSASNAGSRAPTSTAPSARPPTPECSPPGATCAR